MNRHMVGEAGSRFFEMASSLGRIHADTLTGLADATAKTPLGPVFAINATFMRMANDGIETLASRMSVDSATVIDTTTAPTVKAPVVKAPATTVTAKTPAAAKAKAKPAAGSKKIEKPAPFAVDFAVEKTSILSAVDLAEPDVADVLIDEAMIDDVSIDPIPQAPAVTALAKDNLTLINGIGATTEKKLNSIGIESFAQIAAMTEQQFADVLASLDIKSIRFSPALWIDAAKTFSA